VSPSPTTASQVTAFVALGANLGDRMSNLRAARDALAALPVTRVLACSPVYETEPVGGRPQGAYLNAVVAVETGLAPRPLLEGLLAIEAEAGRDRSGERDEPRFLDLDLLLHGETVLTSPGLVLPHPRLHQRAFVLTPLAQLAPALRHPVLGETVAALEGRVHDDAAVRPWPEALGTARADGTTHDVKETGWQWQP
jgi:2-amino-4-hydroxy-6-hydroxymethyldihydropteridine diphosphokinase